MPTPLVFGVSLLRVPDDASELANVLQCEVADALAIAGRTVRLVSVTGWDEASSEPEFVLVEFMDDASKIEIPLDVLDYVGSLDELEAQLGGEGEHDDDDDDPLMQSVHSVQVVRDRESEKHMVRSLAAESIQEAYKRYRECKPALRAKRFNKSQQLVLALASDTIKSGIRRSLAAKARAGAGGGLGSVDVGVGLGVGVGEEKQRGKDVGGEEKQPVLAPTEEPLPPGYERRFDEAKNRFYYVNHNDKTTSWRPPRPTATATATAAVPRQPALPPIAAAVPTVASAPPTSAATAARAPAPTTTPAAAPSPAPAPAPTSTAPTPAPAPVQAPRGRRPSQSSSASASSAAARTVSPLRAASPANTPSQPQPQPQPQPPPAPRPLVVDVAFSRAFRAECAAIAFTPREVLILLDALEVPLSAGALAPASPSSAPDPASPATTVAVPALHPAAFAATVTAYAQQSVPHLLQQAQALDISQAQAETALRRIRALVEGPWQRRARGLLLGLSSGAKHGKLARPSLWPAGHARGLFVGALGLPDATPLAELSGRDLLALDVTAPDTALRLGLGPTLLATRLAVYLHALRLLEQWWEQGHRPTDEAPGGGGALSHLLAPAAVVGGGDGGGSLPSVQQAPPPQQLPLKAPRKKSSVGAATAPVPGAVPTSPKRWGQVGGSAVRSSGGGGTCSVEVAPVEALLQAWAPLNRAYGWGVALDALSGLGGWVGGALGSLVPGPGLGLGLGLLGTDDASAAAALAPVKGCCWVVFPTNTAAANAATAAASPIVRVLGDSAGVAVLIPLQCLRGAADSAAALARSSSLGGGSLAPGDVVVGKRLRVVASLEALQRACERFEWWDRPPPEALEAMAGRRCEVVSVAELPSARRVGVRIEESGAYDALPLEALQAADQPKASRAPRPKPAAPRPKTAPGPGAVAGAAAAGAVAGVGASAGASAGAGAGVAPRQAWGDDESSQATPRQPMPAPLVSVSVSVSAAPAPAPRHVPAPAPAVVPTLDAPKPAAPAQAKAGPRYPVRERGQSAKTRFRGPSSAEIVEAFYRKSLEPKPAPAPAPAEAEAEAEAGPLGPETVEAPPAPAPAWMTLQHQQQQRQARPEPATAPAPATTPAPTPASHPRALRPSVAEFDPFRNAVYDIPLAADAERSGAGARGKAKARPKGKGQGKSQQNQWAAEPAAADEVPGQLRVAVVRPEFDSAGAIFDMPDPEAARAARPKKWQPPASAKRQQADGHDGGGGDEGGGEDDRGDGEAGEGAVEPWEDGREFMVGGLFYHKAQQALLEAKRALGPPPPELESPVSAAFGAGGVDDSGFSPIDLTALDSPAAPSPGGGGNEDDDPDDSAAQEE